MFKIFKLNLSIQNLTCFIFALIISTFTIGLSYAQEPAAILPPQPAAAPAPQPATAPAPQPTASLYDRLGGVYSIAAVVDDFVDRLLADPIITANKKVVEAMGKITKPGLKYRITELLCQSAGGPQKYTGRPMKDSHAHLNITDGEWAATVKDLLGSLEKLNVPEQEQNELLVILGSTKADIVQSQPQVAPAAPQAAPTAGSPPSPQPIQAPLGDALPLPTLENLQAPKAVAPPEVPAPPAPQQQVTAPAIPQIAPSVPSPQDVVPQIKPIPQVPSPETLQIPSPDQVLPHVPAPNNALLAPEANSAPPEPASGRAPAATPAPVLP